MKTEMQIKTGLQSERKMENKWSNGSGVNKLKNRLPVLIRGCACAALLALLAVGGYTGAAREEVRMTAAPVAGKALADRKNGIDASLSFEEIKQRLLSEREKEIALLDSVLSDPSADDSIKKDALDQKLQLAERMENQAQIEAALSFMGYPQAAALFGAEQLTLILAGLHEQESADSLKIIDAASSVCGVEAQDIKIILEKNEEEDCAAAQNLIY